MDLAPKGSLFLGFSNERIIFITLLSKELLCLVQYQIGFGLGSYILLFMIKVLYVTFKQKGLFAGPISAIVTLSGQGGLNAGVLKVNF